MLKTLIAAIASFFLGVIVTKHFDDKKIIEIHRANDRAKDTLRSETFRDAWNDGYQYAKDRFGISEN
jgi:hypothetical protein